MKTILALGAGVVLALAPSGTAFAAVAEPHSTGQGLAHGNCAHSSAGGRHAPLPGSVGKGNGGHVQRGKPVPCVTAVTPPAEGDTTGTGATSTDKTVIVVDGGGVIADEDATIG